MTAAALCLHGSFRQVLTAACATYYHKQGDFRKGGHKTFVGVSDVTSLVLSDGETGKSSREMKTALDKKNRTGRHGETNCTSFGNKHVRIRGAHREKKP